MITQEMLVNEAHQADLQREAARKRRHQQEYIPDDAMRDRLRNVMIELGAALLRYTPEPPANFEPNPVR